MVLGEGLSSRVTSSSVTSSRGSTSRGLEQLIIEFGSFDDPACVARERAWCFLVACVGAPAKSRQAASSRYVHRQRFYTLGQACCQGSRRSGRSAFKPTAGGLMQQTLPDLWAHPSPCNLATQNTSCHVSHAETTLDISPPTNRNSGTKDWAAGHGGRKISQPHHVIGDRKNARPKRPAAEINSRASLGMLRKRTASSRVQCVDRR
jgi:hypothetical protein